MKKVVVLLILTLGILKASAISLQNETLNYKVLYKWGLVQKQAGTARLTLTKQNGHYTAKLIARSDKWADKFYKLRDTLISKMDERDILPVSYERIANENGNYARDIIKIERKVGVENGTVKGSATRIRRKKNATETTENTIELLAEGTTVDMLSAFYYIRSLDFNKMQPGYTKKINIFSGKKKELLTIKYIGNETIDLDGKKYPTYKISFIFTSDGKKKSSDDIETWIWANDRKIPLKMEGKLKVGKIRCLYTSQ